MKVRKYVVLFRGPLLFSPLARRRYKGSQHSFILINRVIQTILFIFQFRWFN